MLLPCHPCGRPVSGACEGPGWVVLILTEPSEWVRRPAVPPDVSAFIYGITREIWEDRGISGKLETYCGVGCLVCAAVWPSFVSIVLTRYAEIAGPGLPSDPGSQARQRPVGGTAARQKRR